ncbi:unnamed protein product [Urochloa decumbens]|uniref:Uncharacterized protein n=1 Tax=Urochloa decumbens TaxID=240449 RepID=A0ABC8VDL9_9POAL
MGNCIQQSSGTSSTGRRLAERSGRRRRGSGEDDGEGATAGAPPSVVKVKMMLTKGELGWLVARLEAGDRRIEDVLHEMAARKREGPRAASCGAGDGWRPSLESIVECPAEAATEAGGDGSED